MSNISRKFSKLNSDYERRIIDNQKVNTKNDNNKLLVGKKVENGNNTLFSKLTLLGRIKSFFSDFKTNRKKQTLFSLLLTLLVVSPFIIDNEIFMFYALPLVRFTKWVLVAIVIFLFYKAFKFIFKEYFWKRKGWIETIKRSTIVFLGILAFGYLLEYTMLSLNIHKSNSMVKYEEIKSNDIKENGMKSKTLIDLQKKVVISNMNHNRLIESQKNKPLEQKEPIKINIWRYLLMFFVPVVLVSVFRYFQIKKTLKKRKINIVK